MKAVVVFDSVKGNTRRVAEAIGRGIGGDVQVIAAPAFAGVKPVDLSLLVVGSPTMGGRPTKGIQDALGRLPPASLKHARVAAFDTRLETKLVKVFGYAAGKIAAALEAKGARMIATPEGFLVKGRAGPLAEGEAERAAAWGKTLAAL
jgi:flavodoxin I